MCQKPVTKNEGVYSTGEVQNLILEETATVACWPQKLKILHLSTGFALNRERAYG
jgi:hypothetical protein